MTDTMRPSHTETVMLCHEICTLLGTPHKEVTLDQENSFETKVADTIVDALVKYGKRREQIRKISLMSVLLCQYMGLGQKYCSVLGIASQIYDIGNLSLDATIYMKDMKLSFEEFEIIKHHTIIGHDALRAQSNPTLDMAALVSWQHHEWYDGTGYPQRLKGDQISIAARIVALADTVVTLSSDRPGREKMSFPEIIMHVEKRKGLHFDPDVVTRFLEHKQEVQKILGSR
jgi:HD-GYP domain-containing protein (c-di-GMP phosphodiesterase class II)